MSLTPFIDVTAASVLGRGASVWSMGKGKRWVSMDSGADIYDKELSGQPDFPLDGTCSCPKEKDIARFLLYKVMDALSSSGLETSMADALHKGLQNSPV